MLRPRPSIVIALGAMIVVFCAATGCSQESAPVGSVAPAAGATTSVAPSSTESSETSVRTSTASRFTTYRDRRNRFTIQFPASWEETNLTALGDPDVSGFEVVGFADHDGPTKDGCYLNFIQVSTYDDRTVSDEILGTLRSRLPQTLDRLRAKHSEVQVLETWRDVEIAGSPGMTLVLSLTMGDQKVTGLDCVLVANQHLYEIELVAVQEDWEVYQPLFLEILESFRTDVS